MRANYFQYIYTLYTHYIQARYVSSLQVAHMACDQQFGRFSHILVTFYSGKYQYDSPALLPSNWPERLVCSVTELVSTINGVFFSSLRGRYISYTP